MNMLQNDDENFEDFLKQFRPRAPRRLPIEGAARSLAFWALLASAAVVLAVAVFLFGDRREPSRLTGHVPFNTVKALTSSQPLTLGRANALLVQAPSVQAALDSLAFHFQGRQMPKGTRSALAALGEENFREKIKL